MKTSPINYEFSGSAITAKSRSDLKGQWGKAVLATFVIILVSGAVNIVPLVGPLLVGGPLSVGIAVFVLKIARGQKAEIGNVFEGFQMFLTSFLAYLMMFVLMFIGFLFLIIPGIIVALGLSQTFLIIADNPSISPGDALKRSWEMMRGHKLNYFLLTLRFIGWAILCTFTLFIGLLWLLPYMQVSFANFYDKISGRDSEDFISDHLVEM